MALAITIALHVALVAGLLAIKVVEAVKQYTVPIQLQDIEEKPKTTPTEVPIEVPLGKPVAHVPDPDVRFADVPVEDTIVATVDVLPDVGPLEVQRDTGAIVPTLPDTPLRFEAVRPTDDYYPPAAIRMAIEGAVIIRACTDARGHLVGMPSVVSSSRASLLDAAAIKWASEALRFQPATQAGRAIAACKEFRVSFRLH